MKTPLTNLTINENERKIETDGNHGNIRQSESPISTIGSS